jgi:hypothetical protein
MAFESKEASRQRNMINTTTKKRSPVGKLDNKIFEREKLKEEVESYPNGMVVNWSDLARRHNIQNTKGELAKNGGQIAQEWLKSEGINITRFKRKHDGNSEKIRRKKLRGQGGEITVATPQTIDTVKAELRGRILSGEYTVGQQIAPRKVNWPQYFLLLSRLYCSLFQFNCVSTDLHCTCYSYSINITNSLKHISMSVMIIE